MRSVSPIRERPALRSALVGLREHQAGVLVVAKRDLIARDVVLAAGVERAVTIADSLLYIRRQRDRLPLTVEHRGAPAPEPIGLPDSRWR
jgi:hypothetical protein